MKTLAAFALLAGLLFFSSLDRLWPLARIDLAVPRGELRSRAEQALASRGFDVRSYRSSSELGVRDAALDYVERGFGVDRTQRFIADGLPLVLYSVYFKKAGVPTSYAVDLHPVTGVAGWRRSIEDDEPRRRIPVIEARVLAGEALSAGLGLDPSEFEERSITSTEQFARRDHSFSFERAVSESPELRERVEVLVAGDQVVAARRTLVVPSAAERLARAAAGPGVALETAGFGLLAAAAIAALVVFLRSLANGSASLARSVVWPVTVLACLIGTWSLETASLFRYWEPLWPPWISNLRYLVLRALEGSWLMVILLAFVAAGDALDRRSSAGRGTSLWLAARGRLASPEVARASIRGFLVGLCCGGVMAAAVLLLAAVFGGHSAIQPRGFFFYTINSASPAATSLLFFLGIALVEELGYRFFAGTWLLTLTRRKWLAVLLPAVVYGLAHTRLAFLPPAEPWWGRPVVLAAVGCVWGWAFFRYDALTVVLSHFTADLFIFNWPRLSSGRPAVVAAAVLTIAVPLLPALAGSLRSVRPSRPAP